MYHRHDDKLVLCFCTFFTNEIA